VALKFHDAEKIAGKSKLRDMAPAVAHVPAEPNHAAHDLVGVSRGIALRENRLVSSNTGLVPICCKARASSSTVAEGAAALAFPCFMDHANCLWEEEGLAE
jgi:hypothetical protein